MSLMLPGVRSKRTDRRSFLAVHWRARDVSLRALTGHDGTLIGTATGSEVGGPIAPATGGVALVAGRSMPRWTTRTGNLVLALSGTTAGQIIEALSFPFSLVGADLSVMMRIRGLWTPGASVSGGLLSVGISDGGAGAIRLIRTSTNYQAIITKLGTGASSVNLAENAALVWPADLLLTYTRATGLIRLTVRGADGTLYGPSGTAGGVAYSNPVGRWGGERLSVGSDAVGPTLGAPLELYLLKVAVGIQTHATMDILE